MNIEIPVGFGRTLSLSVQLAHNRLSSYPLTWSKRQQLALAKEINDLISESYAVSTIQGRTVRFSSHRIGRIKACRFILQERRGLDGGLKESKDFVDIAFNAIGEIAL